MVRAERRKAKVFGTAERPRLLVFRSLKHLYVQVINDAEGKTLLSVSDRTIAGDKKKKISNNVACAKLLGEAIGKKCFEAGIKKIVFDRGKYLYHGRVAAIAEGARKSGLVF